MKNPFIFKSRLSLKLAIAALSLSVALPAMKAKAADLGSSKTTLNTIDTKVDIQRTVAVCKDAQLKGFASMQACSVSLKHFAQSYAGRTELNSGLPRKLINAGEALLSSSQTHFGYIDGDVVRTTDGKPTIHAGLSHHHPRHLSVKIRELHISAAPISPVVAVSLPPVVAKAPVKVGVFKIQDLTQSLTPYATAISDAVDSFSLFTKPSIPAVTKSAQAPFAPVIRINIAEDDSNSLTTTVRTAVGQSTTVHIDKIMPTPALQISNSSLSWLTEVSIPMATVVHKIPAADLTPVNAYGTLSNAFDLLWGQKSIHDKGVKSWKGAWPTQTKPTQGQISDSNRAQLNAYAASSNPFDYKLDLRGAQNKSFKSWKGSWTSNESGLSQNTLIMMFAAAAVAATIAIGLGLRKLGKNNSARYSLQSADPAFISVANKAHIKATEVSLDQAPSNTSNIIPFPQSTNGSFRFSVDLVKNILADAAKISDDKAFATYVQLSEVLAAIPHEAQDEATIKLGRTMSAVVRGSKAATLQPA